MKKRVTDKTWDRPALPTPLEDFEAVKQMFPKRVIPKIELLPCPFCGAEARIEYLGDWGTYVNFGGYATLGCDTKGCWGKVSLLRGVPLGLPLGEAHLRRILIYFGNDPDVIERTLAKHFKKKLTKRGVSKNTTTNKIRNKYGR